MPSARGDLPNTESRQGVPNARPDDDKTIIVPCQGGATLELCVALGWMSNPVDDVPLDMEVEFHSYGLGEQLGAAGAGDSSVGPHRRRGRVRSPGSGSAAPIRDHRRQPLKAVDRAPRPTKPSRAGSAALMRSRRPTPSCARSASRRRCTKLLTYDFELKAASGRRAAGHTVVPQLSALHKQLYDSPIDGAIWRVKDQNGRILAHGGLIHDAKPLSLRAGKYALEVLLRHPDRAALEDMKDLPARLRFNLKDSMACTIVKDRGTATVGGEALKDGFLRKDARRAIYAPPRRQAARVGRARRHARRLARAGQGTRRRPRPHTTSLRAAAARDAREERRRDG